MVKNFKKEFEVLNVDFEGSMCLNCSYDWSYGYPVQKEHIECLESYEEFYDSPFYEKDFIEASFKALNKFLRLNNKKEYNDYEVIYETTLKLYDRWTDDEDEFIVKIHNSY